jgi:DEAD/DEAH box helicase domain-containing protein
MYSKCPNSDLIDELKQQKFYSGQIAYVEHLPEKEAVYGELKISLPTLLKRALDQLGIKLWSHQAEAVNEILTGNNVVLATSTASGKSLAFNLAVLTRLIDDPEATAIYIYPLKALSQDQHKSLSDLLELAALNIPTWYI